MKRKLCTLELNKADLLQPTELAEIQQAISEHLPTDGGLYQIDRIAGNQSPTVRVFKLTNGNDEFVVRILNTAQNKEESSNEIHLTHTMSAEGVAPPVYYANEHTGIIIMKFIKDVSVFKGSAQQIEGALVEFAEKIRRIHRLPLTAKPHSLLPSNLQKERLAEVYKRATLHEAFQIYLQGAEYLNQLSIFIQAHTFCHNNLHKYNILHSGEQGYIIDWETVGAGDPILDLANFVAFGRFTEAQRILFLTAYLGHQPSSPDRAKFQIMLQISYLRYALGQFAATKLEEVNLNSLDFDKIPRFSSSDFVLTTKTPHDLFILSFSLLKEVLFTINSAEFIDALRVQTEVQGLPDNSLSRLFTFSNPKTIHRAERAVQPYVSTTPAIESLTGGSEQATNYKVIVANQAVALRVYAEDTTNARFQREISLYQHATKIGIGPQVPFVAQDELCLATAFINTVPKGWQHQLTSLQLTQIAEKIKSLHKHPLPIQTHELTPTGLAVSSIQKAQTLAMQFEMYSLHDVLSIYQRLLSLIKPEVLSHNSLSKDNILFDGQNFHFIDWENATINDKLYDPAFLSCYFFLTPAQEKVLFSAYLGHQITPDEDKKFYLMKLLVLCHLSIVTITKCQDFAFIKTLPPIDAEQRYFNYQGKARHLLNLQTDFGKYQIFQLLVNEVQFIMQTGKFLLCEKLLLKPLNQNPSSTFNSLPLLAKRAMFSFIPKNNLAQLASVNRDWARTYYSLADSSFPEPKGLEAIQPKDRPKVLSALQSVFLPYKQQNSAVDTFLAPTVNASITPFTSGLSPWANTSKLIINDKPYVIRLMSTEPDASCTRLEISIMLLFSVLGAAPKIHYASSEQGVIIMDYVDAISSWYRETKPETLSQLGLLFNLMNEVNVSAEKPLFTNTRLKEIYNRVYKICRQDFATDPRFNLFRDVLTQLDALKPLCDELTEYTLCHHDFNVWNVLQQKNDQAFKAIDFEFSESGDRLFDIGSLVVFMRLNKSAELELLTSFHGRQPTLQEKSKYYLFKQYAWLHYIVMGLGICKAIDFSVSAEEIEELPPFNQFNQHTTLSKPLDPHSDVGHYKLAIMFIKQAQLDSQTEEYRSSFECLFPKKEEPSLSL